MTGYYRNQTGAVRKIDPAPVECDPFQWTPVVVIDPEDREAIIALAADYHANRPNAIKWEHCSPGDREATANAMQAALREMVKPEPPKCTAAISLDGIEFKRCEADQHDESRPHRCGGYTWTGGAS